MLRTHKIRLDPNQAQASYLARACGVARFAWNWALAEWQRQYAAHLADPTQPKPNQLALRRQLNSIKREQFPWMLEVTKCAPQEALINLGAAYQNWFQSLAGKRKGPTLRPPRFKKKGQHDSFKLSAGNFAVDGKRLRIAGLGWVRLREPLRFSGRPVSVTVSRTAHAWHAAITVETDDLPARCESQAAVGVDVGLHHLAVFSDGTPPVVGPKALGRLLQKLRRLSRALSRKQKGSANRRKAAQALARLNWRIACVRNDALHKLTDHLTRQYGWVAIEDLNVKGMVANRRLARHLSDASFGEFRRQLTYKAAQRGVHMGVVDRWYPSSKTCSVCGQLNPALRLADRFWTCACGAEHDRDLNAARNILAESIRITTPGVGVVACGAVSADAGSNPGVKLAAMKQEVQA